MFCHTLHFSALGSNRFTLQFQTWNLLHWIWAWLVLRICQQNGKQCGSWWDGSLRAVSSESTLFAEISVLVCRDERTKHWRALSAFETIVNVDSYFCSENYLRLELTMAVMVDLMSNMELPLTNIIQLKPIAISLCIVRIEWYLTFLGNIWSASRKEGPFM